MITRSQKHNAALERQELPAEMCLSQFPLSGCITQVIHCDADKVLVALAQREPCAAAVSPQLLTLSAGQTVLVVIDPTGAMPPLITAAWPMPGEMQEQPWAFNSNTGELQLRASRLSLEADTLMLRSGDAYLQLNADSTVELRGEQITSAAIETHRIEGGSIELN